MASAIPYNPWRPAPFADLPHQLPCFLCPVCSENLFEGTRIRNRPCKHVVLLREGNGGLYCWSDSLNPVVAEAWKRAAETGAQTLDVLRQWLDEDFLFFELLESTDADEASSRTVVVDLASPSRVTRPLR